MIMRIKELRTAAGMLQVELAARAGVSQSTITCWETEAYLPRTRDLPLLANIFGVRIDELFDPKALLTS